ncbi:hypothetical protein GWI33_018761 [Rhynchophorus ferrugineus]|uniref:Large ribosomal subunit protein mL44 n=1 Tax=Rhynchophorus ferrugineus TaxID=354439 RepID=A0A834M263_RHYFE|nr:hypothetical protein GWI33_018761 [Rhynchophorus ferrugineus]
MLCRQTLNLTSRIINQNLIPIQFINSRNIKRWVSPTIKEINRRRKKVGPDPIKPRYSYLEWNYDVELYCFGKRVGETFKDNFLREALVQREYANVEEFRAEKEGNESYVPEESNTQLASEGHKIIYNYIGEVYLKSYPQDVTTAIQNYLTSDKLLGHVAKYLGLTDLVKSVEYPPETKTLADAFKAIVAALESSSGLERAQLFVKDFVIVQMNGKDVYDIWTPERPFDYLMKLLEEKGIKEVEPRLCNQSAVNTILANYQVGLYNKADKKLLGIGWGESVKIAKDTAALDAIQKIYCKHNSN